MSEPAAEQVNVIRLFSERNFAVDPCAPFGAEARRWLELREGLSASTLVTYRARLERVLALAPRLADFEAGRVRERHIEELACLVGKQRRFAHQTKRVHIVLLLMVARDLLGLDLPLRAFLPDGRSRPRRRPKTLVAVEQQKNSDDHTQLDLFGSR
ncbi:MAG: hypothetical protein IT384_10410 [Deltaproteobacteria bacterium]|nr:hypothetical protein [Deltaproteobacteria bacterium]